MSPLLTSLFGYIGAIKPGGCRMRRCIAEYGSESRNEHQSLLRPSRRRQRGRGLRLNIGKLSYVSWTRSTRTNAPDLPALCGGARKTHTAPHGPITSRPSTRRQSPSIAISAPAISQGASADLFSRSPQSTTGRGLGDDCERQAANALRASPANCCRRSPSKRRLGVVSGRARNELKNRLVPPVASCRDLSRLFSRSGHDARMQAVATCSMWSTKVEKTT